MRKLRKRSWRLQFGRWQHLQLVRVVRGVNGSNVWLESFKDVDAATFFHFQGYIGGDKVVMLLDSIALTGSWRWSKFVTPSCDRPEQCSNHGLVMTKKGVVLSNIYIYMWDDHNPSIGNPINEPWKVVHHHAKRLKRPGFLSPNAPFASKPRRSWTTWAYPSLPWISIRWTRRSFERNAVAISWTRETINANN